MTQTALTGNDYPGNRREAVPPNVGKPADTFNADVPSPPAHIEAKAKRLFTRIATEMSFAGVLRRVDEFILAEFCQATCDIARLQKEIRKKGETYAGPNGGDVHHPKLGILKDARRRQKEYADRLGLSPKSRVTLKFPRGDHKPDQSAKDQLELFFTQGKLWNRPDGAPPPAAPSQSSA